MTISCVQFLFTTTPSTRQTLTAKSKMACSETPGVLLAVLWSEMTNIFKYPLHTFCFLFKIIIIDTGTNIVSLNNREDRIPNSRNEDVEWNTYIKRVRKILEPYRTICLNNVDDRRTQNTLREENDIVLFRNHGRTVLKKCLSRSLDRNGHINPSNILVLNNLVIGGWVSTGKKPRSLYIGPWRWKVRKTIDVTILLAIGNRRISGMFLGSERWVRFSLILSYRYFLDLV